MSIVILSIKKRSSGATVYVGLKILTWDPVIYTTLTHFSTKYIVMCKVYTDVGGIK